MRSFFTFLPEHKNLPIQLGEDEEGLLLRVLVPGVAKENLSLELCGQNLRVCGQIQPQPGYYQRQERPNGIFCRTLRLGKLAEGLEAGQIEADLHNGVLTVRLPKRKSGTAKRRISLKPD